MNSACSNSTISTTASLKCSISSKNMLLSGGSRNTGFKAARNAKYKLKAVGSSRWRAPDRRDSSLNNLIVKNRPSLSSQLGRGLDAMRLGSNHNLVNAEFKEAPFAVISFNKDHDESPIFIKSAELNRALHREIDLDMLKDNESGEKLGEKRWSARISGEKSGSALHKPKRQKSGAALHQPIRQPSDNALQQPTRQPSDNNLC